MTEIDTTKIRECPRMFPPGEPWSLQKSIITELCDALDIARQKWNFEKPTLEWLNEFAARTAEDVTGRINVESYLGVAERDATIAAVRKLAGEYVLMHRDQVVAILDGAA